MLRARMLPTAGKKAVLINRLVETIRTENGITKEFHIMLERINMDDYRMNKEDRGYVEKEKLTATMTQQTLKAHQINKSISCLNENKPEKIEEQSATNIRDIHSMTLRNQLKGRQNQKNVEEQKEATNTKSKLMSDAVTVVSEEIFEPPEKKSRKTNTEQSRSKAIALKQKTKPKRMKKLPATALCLRPAFQKYEMVWAHVRGYRNWPGIIEEETPKGKYKIHFFGDYSTSDVGKNQIMHLLGGFKDYAVADKPTQLLYKAISEAQLFILEQNRKTCPICELFKLKAQIKK